MVKFTMTHPLVMSQITVTVTGDKFIASTKSGVLVTGISLPARREILEGYIYYVISKLLS
jgi:hypothetical protein